MSLSSTLSLTFFPSSQLNRMFEDVDTCHVIIINSVIYIFFSSSQLNRMFEDINTCHVIIIKTVINIFCLFTDRLVGLVVKASASRAKGPGFESCAGIFRGRVIPVT